MARSGKRPPPYEQMRTHLRGGGAPLPPDPEPSSTPGQWLRPGGSIRIPAGTLLVAVAIVMAIVVAVYIIGYRRGGTEMEARLANLVLEPLRNDPLVSPEAVDPQTPGGNLGSGSAIPSTGPEPTSPSRSEAMWGSLAGVTLTPGSKYFILSETVLDGAERLARFCRERGLETYVIPSDNTRLRRVAAFPALATASRDDPATRELQRRIRQIGRLWKTAGGVTDLSDAYVLTWDSP
jgi:hypothetical protein